MTGKQAVDSRIRLDELLIKRGLFATRSRARDAIERATVRIDGEVATKPGLAVAQTIAIEVDDPARAYVSRAALKLIAGLDHFGIDATGCLALDLGASTGGFTQVLLERGVERVIAVDVGHGQMAPRVARNGRVDLLEGMNARDLDAEALGDRVPDLIVCDVSFISLKLALPPALDLAADSAKAVILMKPQFEAGRDNVGKGGMLKNPDDAPRLADELSVWLGEQPGWRVLGICDSPITGADGNHEYLLGAVKDR